MKIFEIAISDEFAQSFRQQTNFKIEQDVMERTLRRRGCGIHCNCAGRVRNDI